MTLSFHVFKKFNACLPLEAKAVHTVRSPGLSGSLIHTVSILVLQVIRIFFTKMPSDATCSYRMSRPIYCQDIYYWVSLLFTSRHEANVELECAHQHVSGSIW